MGFIRKLGLALTIPLGFYIFRLGQAQYQLQKLTYFVDEISPEDASFESTLYADIWGSKGYESVESWAVGIAVPFQSVPPHLWDEESFGKEVFLQLWNSRLTTQFGQPPVLQSPKTGQNAINPRQGAQVVSVGRQDMSIATINRPSVTNVLPTGYEHIVTAFDRENEVAMIMIKYIWHMKKPTPPSWRKSLVRFFQINGRRQWLLSLANSLANQRRRAEGKPEL
ncbi:hypothetical protein F5Y16DRAFT_259855 [Xylariaceae sp. FL0255]|nr:hypothetical protein F5Y16DRAFT_259855 [Xylariaceae sp. FL0255]